VFPYPSTAAGKFPTQVTPAHTIFLGKAEIACIRWPGRLRFLLFPSFRRVPGRLAAEKPVRQDFSRYWFFCAAIALLGVLFAPARPARASCGDYVTITNPHHGPSQLAAQPMTGHDNADHPQPEPRPCSGPMCSGAPPAIPPLAPVSEPPPARDSAVTIASAYWADTAVSYFDRLANARPIRGYARGIEHPPR
jgi:hypothetical protein